MRVLHVVTLVTPTGAYGGPVRVAINQASHLLTAGHESVIVGSHLGYDGAVPRTMGSVQCRLFPARRVVPRSGFAGLTSPGLHQWLRTNVASFDVVHVHLARDLVTIPALLLAARRRPAFVQPHGMIDESRNMLARAFDRPLTLRALREAQAVFHLTAAERTSLLSLGVEAAQLRSLPNGVPPAPSSGISRRRDVLFLARLHPRKNAIAFVRSAIALAPRFSDWTFSLVGPDEGDADAVRRAISGSGLEHQIRYEGALAPESTLDRMRGASILALPSFDEPFPMSVLEGLSVGLPAVVTDTCGIARIIEDAGAGLVTDGSQVGLTEKLDLLLSSRDRLAHMSERARFLADNEFSMHRVGELLVEAYSNDAGVP